MVLYFGCADAPSADSRPGLGRNGRRKPGARRGQEPNRRERRRSANPTPYPNTLIHQTGSVVMFGEHMPESQWTTELDSRSMSRVNGGWISSLLVINTDRFVAYQEIY